jgi:hypothetical protein
LGGAGGGGDSDLGVDGGPAQAGTANTGGGGGASHNNNTAGGAAGGSGVVIIKEPLINQDTSSCWDLRQVFRQVKAGNWTN